MTVADIISRATGERSLTKKERESLRVGVHQVMNRIAKRDIIKRVGTNGRTVLWRTVST